MGPRDNSLPDEGNLLTELQHFQGFCGRLPWCKTIVDIKSHVLCLSLVCTVKEGLRPTQHTLTGALETAGRCMPTETASRLPGMLGDTRM